MTAVSKTESTESPDERKGGKPLILILVNRQAVAVRGPRITGMEIKTAAIEQGAAIDLMFQLSLHEGNGKWSIVGDRDTVTVNKNSVFRAVADDDNS